MSGRLQEISFPELKEQQQSPQSSLSDYTDDNTTYVAVVTRCTDGIEDYVDEVWDSLGMPEWALKKFLARRSGYQTNSAISDPHDQAYRDMNLTAIYYSHLKNDDTAEDKLSHAVERVVSGENITLVCYEPDGDSCHRHILIDEISKRVERRDACKFSLSAV